MKQKNRKRREAAQRRTTRTYFQRAQEYFAAHGHGD